MVWRGWDNAEIYDRFVREHLIYRRLNIRVVEFARLQGVKRVLDLGCGTGATTMACLRVLDMDADVLGVDASEEMIEVARANILDPRARFVVAPAAAVAEVAGGTFDRVVCNAAFWQFPAPGTVLTGVSRVLRSGGLFVFNVPAERISGDRAPVHPFQVALARAVEARTGRPIQGSPTRIDAETLATLASEAGLSVDRAERLTYRGRQGELMELMGIPAMIAPLTAGFSEDDRQAVLVEARERSDAEEEVEVPWWFFVLRRGEEE